jgi:hypothetical protein
MPGIASLDLDQCRVWTPRQGPPIRSGTRGAVVMSQIDIAYLALVVIAFGGFAVALAYYAHR